MQRNVEKDEQRKLDGDRTTDRYRKTEIQKNKKTEKYNFRAYECIEHSSFINSSDMKNSVI